MDNRRKICLIVSLLFLFNSLVAQNVNILGYYKGKAAQGMAIYKSNCYLLNAGGYCRIYDLNENKLVNEFPLGSADKNNHANSASFGVEKVGKNRVPVLYVSECAGPGFRCFVENVTESGATLVQTIQARNGDRVLTVHDWVVDAKGKFLYTVTRLSSTPNEEGTIKHRIRKFQLPMLSEGSNIILTTDDILDQFDVSFVNLLQGGTIYKNKLYLPVGLQESSSKTRADRERAVIVIDLKKKEIVKKVILTEVMENEPEDIGFYKSKPYVFGGQTGGLFEINLDTGVSWQNIVENIVSTASSIITNSGKTN